MSKVKTNLTVAEIKELVIADSAVKSAKTAFDILKEAKCKNLVTGKYFADGIGAVYKTSTIRETIDYKRLLADHPEIDIEKYKTSTEVTSVTVKNMMQGDAGFFSKLLK